MRSAARAGLERPSSQACPWPSAPVAPIRHRAPACRYVTVEGSQLRLGVYESSATLCVYLESDALGATLEHNLWVKFRAALLSGKGAGQPEWKQSAICTKTWNNSVLQFPKVRCGDEPASNACSQLCVIGTALHTLNKLQHPVLREAAQPCLPLSADQTGMPQPAELQEAGQGRDAVTLACDILQACPWFEFADLDLGHEGSASASSSTLSRWAVSRVG